MKIIFIKALKLSVILYIVGVIFYWIMGSYYKTLHSLEILRPLISVLDGIMLMSLALMSIPAQRLGLPMSDGWFLSTPTTILGQFLGYIFLFIIIFIIFFVFLLFIKFIKNAYFKS